jgi:hypothetical protein
MSHIKIDSNIFIYNIYTCHLDSFEIWCWRTIEISWTDHVRIGGSDTEIVKKQRNMLHEIRIRKDNWICHILRRNCLLKQVIEGNIKGGIEVKGRRGRRRRKLLDDVKEKRGGSFRSQDVESSLWKRLWTCHKTGY